MKKLDLSAKRLDSIFIQMASITVLESAIPGFLEMHFQNFRLRRLDLSSQDLYSDSAISTVCHWKISLRRLKVGPKFFIPAAQFRFILIFKRSTVPPEVGPKIWQCSFNAIFIDLFEISPAVA